MVRKLKDKPGPNDPLEWPGIIVIDTREQLPFGFTHLRADAHDQCRPLQVHTVRATLKQGDYSILGHEKDIALERKSLSDLYSTISQSRDRFVRELERLAIYPTAGIVVEADWNQILTEPPPHSRLPPKTVYRSIIAWSQRYPRVHWWMMGSRRLAEVTTFRILERFWRDEQEHKRNQLGGK